MSAPRRSPSPARLRQPVAVLSLLLLGVLMQAAAAEPAPPPAAGSLDDSIEVAATESEATAEPEPSPARPRRAGVASVCDEPGSEGGDWLDQLQRGVYYGVCGSAYWFDGLFGTARYDLDSGDSYGRFGVFPGWDRRDGLDTRVRLRARFVLPAMQERLALVVGRGDRQDITEESASSTGTPVPPSFRRIDDDEWLVGLVYAQRGAFENGFDVGAGIRLRTPLDPYVKAGYRHHFGIGDHTLLRLRETLFWRDSRGFGSTTELLLDRMIGEDFMVRWNNTGTLAGDTEGLEWGSSLSLFHNLSERRAMVYSVLSEGETSADVRLQNYGVETRYRQRIARRWLFLEVSASATWPRETLEERRRINPGIGIGFEMYFGPVPEGTMR